MYISSNGYISFSGEQASLHGAASNPETTVVPSSEAKPDNAIFVYWTDLDFTECDQRGDCYISLTRAEDSTTVTW